jgi:hypothetical protein
MHYPYARDLEEGDVLLSGRKVLSVEPADVEWAGERPIGYNDRVLVTFSNADPDYFDAEESVQVITTLANRD